MSVLGLGETLAALDGVKELFGMEKALEEGAKIIHDDAVRRCKSSEVAAAIEQHGPEVRVEHERAAVEEFGTGPRAGLQGPHNFPARPYFRPAIDENIGEVVKVLTKHYEGASKE